eukprot:Seg2288.2 transcript_id=Seg2288.2/GoldUCD/mRNA.D3Y31 product="hypothetical protein" protein_id=Seg2288.2/GoldUCD/D3Y31
MALVPGYTGGAKFFGPGSFQSYARNQITNYWWKSAEKQLSLNFSFCNPDGVLLYQKNGTNANEFFAMFIYQYYLFYEWHGGVRVKEAYVDSKLSPNTSYDITLDHLGYSNTTASVNGVTVSLVTLTGGISGIQLEKFNGRFLIGGFEKKDDVKGIRAQAQTYAVTCINYLKASTQLFNFSIPTQSSNVQDSCPTDMCTSQDTVTFLSTRSFLGLDILKTPTTSSHDISLRFRTR